MEAWRTAELREVARPIVRQIAVEPGMAFRTIGVRWWGEGAYERATIDGSQTAARSLSLVRAGDLIINKIWVRHGSTAVATTEVDGCAASSEFPTFSLDTKQINPRWLHWLAKSRAFWAQCSALSRGTSGKNRIKPELFLSIRIPVPSLAEQERVIGRIEEVAAQVSAANVIRQEADLLAEGLMRGCVSSVFDRLAKTTATRPLGDYLARFRKVVTLNGDVEYKGLGTRMWGEGVYIHEQRLGRDFEAERYSVMRGQLVYNEVWAHNGALGIVPDLGRNTVVSRHFHVFDVEWSVWNPHFLQRAFQSRWFWAQCQAGSVSTTGRGHLRRGHLAAVGIPSPALDEQVRIVEELNSIQEEMGRMRALQVGSKAELDALLPAILDRAFKGEL